MNFNGKVYVMKIGLGIASIMGSVRVFPAFWTVLNEPGGLYNSVCVK